MQESGGSVGVSISKDYPPESNRCVTFVAPTPLQCTGPLGDRIFPEVLAFMP